MVDLDTLDADMEVIIAAISVPGSVPLGIMGAGYRSGTTEDDEARRFDESLDAQFGCFEEAVARLG